MSHASLHVHATGPTGVSSAARRHRHPGHRHRRHPATTTQPVHGHSRHQSLPYGDALAAGLVAAALAALLTPLAARFAKRIGAVDKPKERGLSPGGTPLLGGLAILVAGLVAGAIWMPATINLSRIVGGPVGPGGMVHTWTIAAGAVLIALVGAIDDIRDLSPLLKLIGQICAAVIAVEGGAVVNDITVPFIGSLTFPNAGGVITVIWLVGMMNVVNFSDGVDGLAAGLCTIDGLAFAVIAFDLDTGAGGILAAIIAGAAAGFLVHNFPRPKAKVFMGDSGANLLGYMLGVVAVVGSLKKSALVALAAPLLILAVPFLDTGFVVAKRLKYGNKPWAADANHFHHRMRNIGFSDRKTVLYLYSWTLLLACVPIALRFVPYSDHHGHYKLGWSLVMVAIGLIAIGASVYLVYVLEILKFKHLRSGQLREIDPDTSDHEIIATVKRDIETGEFEQLARKPGE